MINWFTKFNLAQMVLIFSICAYFILPVYSLENPIIPNVNPVVEECDEVTDVIPTCLRTRETPSNAAELITGDLGVCRCIEKTKGNILAPVNSQTPLLMSSEEAKKFKQRRLEQISDIASTSSLLSSTSYSTSKEELSNNMIGYGAGEIRSQLVKSPIEIDGEVVRPPQLDEAFARIGTIATENASWQCVSIQEYQAQRTIPNDNKFYQMLKSSSFSPGDWNENTLKTQFDTANETDRENIRQKLIFLSRNPIFKAILNARPTEIISAELITSKQNQILQTIQKLKPADDSTCFSRPNGCWREAQGNRKINEFKIEAAAFTNDPQVHDIASAQNAKTYMDELRRLSNEGEVVTNNNVPTTPEGYFAYMQSANSDLAQRCAGSNVEASCYTRFASHCSQLQVIDARVRSGLKVNSSELSDQLFEEEAIEARLDPNNNPAFRAFNDSICLQAFANSEGKELNFFQYQAEVCQGENSYPECIDRKKLLSRFLREHNSGGDETLISVRDSFSELVENNEYVDATVAQVATANNISETPAQIRARFGGEYPTISPTGDLVAPVSSIASDTSSSSTTIQTGAVTTTLRDIGVVSPVATTDNRVQSRLPVPKSEDFVHSQETQNYVSAVKKPTPTFLGALNRFEPTQNPVVQNEKIQTLPNPVQLPAEESIEIPTSRTPASSIVTSNAPSGIISNSLPSPHPTGATTVAGGGLSPLTSNNTVPKNLSKTPQNLNFKYGLNRDGTVVLPDVQIIPVVNQSVPLTLDSATVQRVKENPASLVLSSSQISEILANPGSEVPVQIKSIAGESVTVYAKKDSEGNLTYSLEPSAQGRSPASSSNVVRARISTATYESVLNDPDTALNQNEDLINELAKKEDGSTITLQIVSDGKRALTFEVTKKDDLLYHYRLKR